VRSLSREVLPAQFPSTDWLLGDKRSRREWETVLRF
jgi:hypothetical protein